MTRSTNMEHVEVLRVLRERASEWGHETENLSALDAAIAALSAPQPPAEAQPVAWCPACNGAGWVPDSIDAEPVTCPDCAGSGSAEHSITVNEPPSAPEAQGGGEVRHGVEDVLCRAAALAERINYSADHDEAVTLSAELRQLLKKALSVRSGLSLFRHPKWGGATAPPSAPVGVEAEEADELVERVASAIATDGFARPWEDFQDLNAHDTDKADLRDYARAALGALAQQPAAVDEAMVERALDAVFPPTFKRNDALRDMWRTGLTAALAAQQGGSDNDR